MTITIKSYDAADKSQLFALLKREGDEWSEYHTDKSDDYARALEAAATFVLYENEQLLGYCRCHIDNGFGVYIYDLLVDKQARGQQHGNQLMTHVCHQFPDTPVYVMSDVDAYYEKQGYQREGSIFVVVPDE